MRKVKHKKETKHKKSKKTGFTVIILIILIILAGGLYYFLIKDDKGNSIIKKTTTTTTTKVVQIVDLESKSRPYAVMINNLDKARTVQSGLQDAYLIYEMIVEGGLTRYMALFLDQTTERIGSVRSSRHYYLDYALENDAIYIHCGYSPQAGSDFSKLKVDRIEVGSSKNSWRDTELRKQGYAYEHTLFTNIKMLNDNLGSKRTERKGDLLFKYDAYPIDLSQKEGATIANKASFKYSKYVTSEYEYDEENKIYKRSVNGKVHKDYVTGQQYTFKNIIAYQVKNYTLDDPENKGRQGLENIGSGEGIFISNGYSVPIKWKKESRSAKTVYTYQDGTEIVLNDGNTFIQIVPKSGNITVE